MSKPIVSVIIPCYNAAFFLKEALDSIVKQTYKSLEILIIDDGSTDNSLSICNEYSNTDDRIQVIENKSNIGLVRTLNKGISIAKGQYIARMDADDISHLNRIEKQIEYLSQHTNISVLGCNALSIDMNSKVTKKSSSIYCESQTISFSAFFTQALIHGSVLAKANVLKENLYDINFKHSEDFELWLRLISKNHQIANIDEVLYYYRINESGVSQQNSETQIMSHNKASFYYLNQLTPKDLDYNVVAIINNRPEKAVNVVDFQKAVKQFNSFYDNFTFSKELESYYQKQLIDISIQAYKKVAADDKKTKKVIRRFVLSNLKGIKSWSYLLSKF